MSYIPDNEKYGNFFQLPQAPPIRKLFSPVTVDDGESSSNETDTFKVFLRIKPNTKIGNENDCIKISDSTKLICKPPITSKFKKLEKVEYTFSHIFGPATTQNEIFSKCVVNCVEDLLKARNSLIFAYGTTNAGKTFTVQGTSKNPGIIPQVLHTLFTNIEIDRRIQYKPYMAKDILKLKSSTSQEEFHAKTEILRSFRSCTKYSKSTSSNNDSSHFMQALQKSSIDLKRTKPSCSVWISFLEVYNETIYDLLDSATASRKPLKLAADHCDNFYVKGLKQIHVSSAEEAFTIYQFGKKNLNVASTKMNENSSRSHCIFTIHVINLEDKDQPPIISKLCICDLAGTERQTKTQNTGQRLKESGSINGSLFQLNRCLRTIRDNQTKRANQKIPYRYSNLTKLLQSALDDRTDEQIVMIVNINPSADLYDETQQVLKMCAVASTIKNKPIANKSQQSSRFTTLIYGRNNVSDDGDRRNDLSDFEEDLQEESDELEPHDLKEKLMRVEEELARLQEHVKIREDYHENTKRNLKEYCEKIETTYKSRVKSLEERLRSQKEYYMWKVKDVKKSTLLESTCSCNDSAKEELLLKKDARIEELEKKLLELQHDDGFKRLSLSEEMQEKEVKIKELESLVQEAKEEYILLEKKYKADNLKLSKLEDELCEKNEIVESLESALNSKQNIIEELEHKIDNMEETSNQCTIEYEKVLHELEKDRDSRLVAKSMEIEKLNLEVDFLKQRINELFQKDELLPKTETDNENVKSEVEKEKTRAYNTRRNNRTPSGKENRFVDKETLVESGSKSTKKGSRGKPKTPLNFFHDVQPNVLDSMPEIASVSKSRKKRLFAKFPTYEPSCDSSVLSKDGQIETATPAETVKLVKRNALR